MTLTNKLLKRAVKTYQVCETDFLGVRPRITCRDGLNISIQAGRGYSCLPENDDGPYTHVELGYPMYPSRLMLKLMRKVGIPVVETLIFKYAVDKYRLEKTIYQRVPVEIVDKFLEEHGGVKGVCEKCTDCSSSQRRECRKEVRIVKSPCLK